MKVPLSTRWAFRPDLTRTTSLGLGLKCAEGKRPGQFSNWDFWFERVLTDLHEKVLF